MNDQDTDHLLERGFSGEPPCEAFRLRVLRDSTAAFVHARKARVWWRWRLAAFNAAAVVVAAASFLLGRYSAPPSATPLVIARGGNMVAVPSELVVWLDAARLFKQLHMQDRMSRALDRAANLLPREALARGADTRPVFAVDYEATERQGADTNSIRTPDRPRTVESINRIMAQSLGGTSHANGMD
jgi:hypothetical protein